MAQLHRAIASITDDIIKPDVDKRQWRALKLQNEMSILIVSDPDTDKSAASMNVHVGSMSDPVDVPGIAHFCEHMVFLGSEKYPGENTYADFIYSHGGMTNAYTGKEDTNFHFDVAPTAFKEALDIFAQFFLCPLFTESATDRELNAVDNEHQKNVKNDSWRLHQLQHHLSKSDHDYHKFATGSKETLETIPKKQGIKVREQLLKFHGKFYSSNLMCLAVFCKESLDEITSYICDLFGGAVNKKVKEPTWSEPPYGVDQLRRRIQVVPIKDIRKLELIWPCDDLQQWWESMPEHYVGHLVGHEGKGSLLSALKAKGWVNSLSAGGKSGAKGFAFLVLRAELTEEGLAHVDDIITISYQYINMIRSAGPQERIVDEAKDLNLMNFKFKDNEKPISLVMCMAECLRLYPLEEVLSGPYLWKKYDPKVIEKLISKLVPENMMSLVVSKKFEGKTDQSETWYKVDYAMVPHPAELEEAWRNPEPNDDLMMPEPNAFIPHDFSLCERDSDNKDYPRIIRNTAMTRCWFKQDDEYLLPKGHVTFSIRSPQVSNSPLNANLTWLFLRLFNDTFAEYSYDAELTRLTYNLTTAHYGFLVKVGGYTDKLSVLLEKIMSTLTTFKPDEKRINIFADEYAKGLRNFEMAQPTTHADYRIGLLLREGGWTVEEMLECVDEMTIDNLLGFIPQLLSRIHIEALVHGNFTVSTALSLVDMVENSLINNLKSKPLPHSQQSRGRREAKLPDDCNYEYSNVNQVHPASCVYNYYQLGLESTQTIMLLELLHQIIKDPCFQQLRTKEQLGYLVYAHMRRGSGVQGLQIVVQSNKHPVYVNHRIEAFLATLKDYLENLTDADYKKHVAGLVSVRLTKPKKMKARHNSYWSEIVGEYYQFDREKVETDYVQTITQQQLVDFFVKYISPEAKLRHKLSVRIVSKDHQEEFQASETELENYQEPLSQPGETISSHIEFKRSMPLFPMIKPAIDIPQITMSKL